MKTFLTGGTGFVGSAVLDKLVDSGHQVNALVRSEASAAVVESRGATALIGDISDVNWLSSQLLNVDGAIHTAAPGDETSADFDAAVGKAVVDAFAGTDRPYVHTGGVWVYGNGTDITEQTPFDPPAITAWRPASETFVLASGVAATVVVPGIVYGRGKGISTLISGGPRTASGALTLIGDGRQHWTTVHVDDLAALYVLILERGRGFGHVIGVSGANPTVLELAQAVAGPAGVEQESADCSRARLGSAFADALLLDQQALGTKARSLGWAPTHPSLLEELVRGSHRN